ncbi:queuine tRNA-ribosyltransferase accessory subunit 2-like isoform X2 [Asterias amurensis]|uniref:queuine tRNA-ribosyltransferase accessory subunit 2-like isoform X2 n=1 Tax=Asterias amurensis TaxID=7602 RepID=UPI003AB7E5B9
MCAQYTHLLQSSHAQADPIPIQFEKMKFNLHNVKSTAGRLATLSELGHHGNISMESPGCTLYTRGGSAPNLSLTLLNGIEGVPPVTQIPIPTIVESQEVLSTLDQGVASFSGRPGTITYSCTQDPGQQSRSGYNDKNSVSVWTPAGRERLTIDRFLSLQEALQVDWMEALSDGDTPTGSMSKRIRKSVDRTLVYLDKCLDAKQSRQNLKDTTILGVIVGGDSLEERNRSVRETVKRPVGGFVLDGFHQGAMEDRTRWSIMESVLNEIPEDKPRFLPRVGRPDEVIQAVELGVDIFDSAFPFEVTERGCALVFSYHLDHPPSVNDEEVRHTLPASSSMTDTDGGNDWTTQCGENGEDGGRTMYEIKLSDQRYVEDFSTLVEGCECYCCVNHTKAYINHLINVKELLAGVLLMIHNFHHHFKFFQSIRQALQEGRMQELKEEIRKTR